MSSSHRTCLHFSSLLVTRDASKYTIPQGIPSFFTFQIDRQLVLASIFADLRASTVKFEIRARYTWNRLPHSADKFDMIDFGATPTWPPSTMPGSRRTHFMEQTVDMGGSVKFEALDS